MKSILISLGIAAILPACDHNTGNKTNAKSNSTILAPETNSNMVDTRPLITDSSKVDSGHLTPGGQKNK